MSDSDQNSDLHAYHALDPVAILDAVESCGYISDGRLLALNSYENRVYQVGLEDEEPIIAKFYRPERWSDEAILEEHDFTLALASDEIPVVPPLQDDQGQTLFHHLQYRFALYPRRGGHAPELDNSAHLKQLGRFMARIHNVGATQKFSHRPEFDIKHFGEDSREYLLQSPLLPMELISSYDSLTADLLVQIRACFERAGQVAILRLHGDSHPGNILCRDEWFHIVDFDDARMGPAMQDLWMFLSGDREHMNACLDNVIEGYSQFRHFNPSELNLIEALRTLRQMHYAAWLARRWDDPAFPQAFPWFDSPRFWEEHILGLREQMSAMQEPPLVMF